MATTISEKDVQGVTQLKMIQKKQISINYIASTSQPMPYQWLCKDNNSMPFLLHKIFLGCRTASMLEDDCQMEQSCDFKHGSFYKMDEASKLMDTLK